MFEESVLIFFRAERKKNNQKKFCKESEKEKGSKKEPYGTSEGWGEEAEKKLLEEIKIRF